MNILFVSSNFPPQDGGIAVFDYNICKEIQSQGHNVKILANTFRGDKKHDSEQKLSIKRINNKIRPTSVRAIFNILSLSIRERIDVVFFGHFASTHWLGGVLAQKILNIPYVILVHGTEFNAYFHWFTMSDRWASEIVLKYASTIIGNSKATKALVESHGYPSNRIYIVNPGIDIGQFRPRDNVVEMRKQLNITNKNLLLSVSRLVRRKGHENVIRALPKVINKIPDLLYIILGKGEEEARLKALVQDMKLDSHVKLVGYVSEKEKLYYYQSCDAFIMTSFEIRKRNMNDYEGFGIVYVEANACGKPVIAGKSGGIEDAVIDGVTGLLVDPGDIGEISQAIIRLLTDKAYAKQLGENGRKRVEKELSWNVVGKKIENILNKTVSKYSRKN